MLQFNVKKDSKIPLYRQITEQIISFIERGILKEGYHLPPSRELAKSLKINRTTVYKAYRELWSSGYIKSRPGSFSVVRTRKKIVAGEPKIPGINWLEKTNPVPDFTSGNTGIDCPEFDFRALSPDPRIIPVDEFRRVLNDVLKGNGRKLLLYGDAAGYKPLREYIAEHMHHHKIITGYEEIMITSGTASALELICLLFQKKKWSVIVDGPTYSKALALFRWFGAEIYDVTVNKEGMELAILEELIREKKPSFIYTMANYHNPTGFTSSQENREGLLRLCEHYTVPLIEDGFSDDMEGTILPIKSMDLRDLVLYMGTFSKVLFPGIRTGWIYGNRECVKKLISLQHMTRLSGNLPVQAALHRFCRLGYYDVHLKRIHKIYRKRMDVALNVLKEEFPPCAGSYTTPAGGYLIWFSLTGVSMTETELLRELECDGVALTPGSPHFAGEVPALYLRLSIAHTNEEEIAMGIKKFCNRLKILCTRK